MRGGGEVYEVRGKGWGVGGGIRDYFRRYGGIRGG
jgi:hypothetical protein